MTRLAGSLLVVALAVAAPATAQTPQRGGTLTELAGSDIDYLDPGHSYYQFGFQIIGAMHRTLYSFTPADAQTPVPDLAAAAPELSEDRKTVTVRLRPGVRFAPPVNREVRAADVGYAIRRAFSTRVGGQYTVFFEDLVGAPSRASSAIPAIAGIEIPDDLTLVFRLRRATGVAFAAALVMPITAPVPEELAAPHDARNPSTYEQHVVASGPYMIPSAPDGRLTGYKPWRSIRLVRNPNWDATTDHRPAYLDEIVVDTDNVDGARAARRVLAGSRLVLDTNPPPEVGRTVARRYPGQTTRVPSGGWRWFPLNTQLAPLNDLNVRKAILAGVNREAVRAARGGAYTGRIPTHFLPPGMPGFEEAGGYKAGEDFMRYPRGNKSLARRYLRRAGYRRGRYSGKRELFVVTANVDPGLAQALVLERELEKLGFRVRLRTVPQDAVYTDWCQVPRRRVHICGSAGWFKDFADASSMLIPTFKGSEIFSAGNNNLPQLRVPRIDRAMEAAELLAGPERAAAWGAIDKAIVKRAPAIPFLWDETTLLWSKDVIGAGNPYTSLLDLSYTGLR